MADLAKRTYILFKDGDSELERSYEGLINLEEGNWMILDHPTPEDIKVRTGIYVVKERTSPDKIILCSGEDQNEDLLYRYFRLEKLL